MLRNFSLSQRQMGTFFFLFCLGVLLNLASPYAQAADDVAAQELYDRFTSTIEKTWKDRAETIVQYSGVATVSIQMNLPKDPQEAPTLKESKASWNSAYPCLVVEDSKGSSENEPQGVFGCNERYSFMLAKDSVTKQWTIAKLEHIARRVRFDDLWNFLSKGTMSANAPKELYLSYSASCLNEFFLPDNSSVIELFSSPSFVVDKYEKTDAGNLKISFSIKKSETNADPRFVPTTFQSGSLEFSPDDWRIIVATTSYGKWGQSMTCEYKQDGKTHLLTSKICKTTYGDGRSTQDEYTYEPVKKSYDADRFLVSYYGLPEPDFGTNKTNLMRLILLGVGVLLIGTFAWRVYRKRAASK